MPNNRGTWSTLGKGPLAPSDKIKEASLKRWCVNGSLRDRQDLRDRKKREQAFWMEGRACQDAQRGLLRPGHRGPGGKWQKMWQRRNQALPTGPRGGGGLKWFLSRGAESSHWDVGGHGTEWSRGCCDHRSQGWWGSWARAGTARWGPTRAVEEEEATELGDWAGRGCSCRTQPAEIRPA